MHTKSIEAEVLYSYLVKEKSDRDIQRTVLKMPAPARGGGFETMKILHKYGITGEFKGVLKNYDFTNISNDYDELFEVIEFIKDNYFFTDAENIDDAVIEEDIYEGKKKKVMSTIIERSTKARNECIKHNGYTCKVCGINFYKKYGEIGKNYIHVHHIFPLHESDGPIKTDFKNDLIPVCPNCHAMLHRKINDEYINYEELKKLIEEKSE